MDCTAVTLDSLPALAAHYLLPPDEASPAAWAVAQMPRLAALAELSAQQQAERGGRELTAERSGRSKAHHASV